MTNALPKLSDTHERGCRGEVSSAVLLGLGFPPAPQLDLGRGPPTPPLPRSHVAGELMPVRALVIRQAPLSANDDCCFLPYHRTPGKAYSPAPLQTAPQDSPGNRPSCGRRSPIPEDPPPPALSNGFPRSSGGRAFPQKEVSSVAGKVLELQESPAAWACPRVPPTPPSRSPAAAPSPRAPARWSQAAPEGSDRPLPAIVSLDGVLGRPALPVSPRSPGLSRPRPRSPPAAVPPLPSRQPAARPGVRGYRGNRPGRRA